MKLTKTTTNTYEIYDCKKWICSVGETLKHREKIGLKNIGFDKCFVCGSKFKDNDFPYLGFVRNHRNVFLCEKCAVKVKNEVE